MTAPGQSSSRRSGPDEAERSRAHPQATPAAEERPCDSSVRELALIGVETDGELVCALVRGA